MAILPRSVRVSDALPQTQLAKPPAWLWSLFVLMVALAPGSSKVAGAIWFLMVGAAGIAFFCSPKAQVLRGEDAERLGLLRLWLYFCAAAFAFKAVGMFYWGDPWWTRHFDFRIVCAAAAMPILMARFQPSSAQRNLLVTALCIASGVALAVAYRFAYHGIDTPSQRINWAGGLVMLACITLPLIKLSFMSKLNQWAMAVATVVLVVAVLLTGSRGSYLALPWVVLGSVWLFGRNLRAIFEVKAAGLRMAMLLLVVLIALPMALPKVFEVPVARVMLGVTEMHAMVTGSPRNSKAIDTSVGTRVYMWRKSEEKMLDSPWIGYGRDQRMAFIQEWGAEVNAEMVTDQTHMHSEYINGMIDHGIFGLLSTLSYMVGVAVLAWKLRKRFPVAAFSVGGIAFTHCVMSFTDTNSQTNNYSVMITVSLLIIFWLALPYPEDQAATAGHPLPDTPRTA